MPNSISEINLNQIEPISLKKDSQGKISLAGHNVDDLAKKFGTPLYVMCEQTIRARIAAYKSAFKKYYPNFQIVYASKAMNCKAILRLMNQEGVGIDVVSAGELHTALKAGVDMSKVIFHGNNKSLDELAMAIKAEIGSIMVDNFCDIANIKTLIESGDFKGKKINCQIRVTPGIECHTHEYIKTGMIDSKFGFNLEELDDSFAELLSLKEKHPELEILGLHAHIGSQIFDTKPHNDLAELFASLYKGIKEKFSLELSVLNVGGGLGIMYTRDDDPPQIEKWIEVFSTALKTKCKDYGLELPKVFIEPGRSIAGPAGINIYKVGNIKDIKGVRKYVSVDGGMADNVRPIMYQAKYDADIDAKDKAAGTELVTVAGKYCESGDILIKDIELPKAKAGDLLVMYATGAYGYAMASNYNRATKAAVVLVNDKQANIIVERESLDDLLQHDKVPDYLL